MPNRPKREMLILCNESLNLKLDKVELSADSLVNDKLAHELLATLLFDESALLLLVAVDVGVVKQLINLSMACLWNSFMAMILWIAPGAHTQLAWSN